MMKIATSTFHTDRIHAIFISIESCKVDINIAVQYKLFVRFQDQAMVFGYFQIANNHLYTLHIWFPRVMGEAADLRDPVRNVWCHKFIAN